MRLIINAPWRRKDARTFEAILSTKVGPGYAISKSNAKQLREHPVVVVLVRKDRNQRRAEGRLTRLDDTSRTTPQGICRYDVHVDDWVEVPYRPEEVNRFGVAVTGT
jgi:hypothetical protein